MAVFRYYEKERGERFGFINKKYEIELKGFQKTLHFSDGLACFLVGKQWGFINKKGKIIIDPQYFDAVAPGFQEGLCSVMRNKDGHYGYINRKGIFKINPIFTVAFPFSCGRAIVVLDGGFYIINKKGKIISEQIAPFTGV